MEHLFAINITGGPMAPGLVFTVRETVRNALNRTHGGVLEPDGDAERSTGKLEWSEVGALVALYPARPRPGAGHRNRYRPMVAVGVFLVARPTLVVPVFPHELAHEAPYVCGRAAVANATHNNDDRLGASMSDPAPAGVTDAARSGPA